MKFLVLKKHLMSLSTEFKTQKSKKSRITIFLYLTAIKIAKLFKNLLNLKTNREIMYFVIG